MNRARLPQVDEEAIKTQPVPKGRLSGDLSGVGTSIEEGQVAGYVYRDLSEILMIGCDGLERRGNPFDAQ